MVNQIPANIAAILAKADKNGDNNIDANEAKNLTSQEQNCWTQYKQQQVNGNNNQIVQGQGSNVTVSGKGNTIGATHGNNSPLNQATGDNAQIVSTYTNLKIDGETAKALVDAGFTSESDIEYITQKVDNKAFKNLPANYQKEVLSEIINRTKDFNDIDGIDNETARVLTKAGIGYKNDAAIEDMKNLVASDSFKKLSSEDQKVVLQAVKHPQSISSLVNGGSFEHFEIDNKGQLKMTSQKHEYQLNLDPNDPEAMENIRTTFSTGNHAATFEISGTETGKITINPDPEGSYNDGEDSSLVRFVSFKGVGNAGDAPPTRLEVENNTSKKHTYVMNSTYTAEVDGKKTRCISNNAVSIKPGPNDFVRSYTEENRQLSKVKVKYEYPITSNGQKILLTENTRIDRDGYITAYDTTLYSSGLGKPTKFVWNHGQWVKTNTPGDNRT